MSDQQPGDEEVPAEQAGPVEAEEQGFLEAPQVIVTKVVEKSARFTKEVVATMISLASAAFGVVAALAWNTAITSAVARYLHGDKARISVLFLYAVVITLIGVVVIVMLGRLAARINAQPVEFKYPTAPKT